DVPDQDNDLNNTESETTSAIGTLTPIGKPIDLSCSVTPGISHNININYCYCYTVEKKDGGDIDIPALLQSLANHTTVQSLSKDLQLTRSNSNKSSSLIKPKVKSLFLTDSKKTITFTALDIS